jgi:hypothetical protein
MRPRRTREKYLCTVPYYAKQRVHLPVQTRIPDQACLRTQLLQRVNDLVRDPHRPELTPQTGIFMSSGGPNGPWGLAWGARGPGHRSGASGVQSQGPTPSWHAGLPLIPALPACLPREGYVWFARISGATAGRPSVQGAGADQFASPLNCFCDLGRTLPCG